MLQDVVDAKTMIALAAKVSSISSKNLRDPVPAVADMRIGFCAVQADRESWDYNRFMQAIKGDFHIRDAFTRDFNTSFIEEIEHTDIGSTPDEMWNRLVARTFNLWKNRLIKDRTRVRTLIATREQIVPNYLWFSSRCIV